MKALLALLALAACTTDDDPARELQKIEACDQGVFEGEPIDQCAAACVNVPFSPAGPSDCRINQSNSCAPMAAFDIDGVRGCCDQAIRVEGKPTLTWRECLN